MERVILSNRFIITNEMALSLDDYEYDKMIKIAAVFKIVQEKGLTPEIIEKWIVIKNGQKYLRILVSNDEEINKNDFFIKQTIEEVFFKLS